MSIEPFADNRSGGHFLRSFRPGIVASAITGLIFAASGPVAIVLAVGGKAGLNESQLSSWIFGSFFVNGILSIAACWLYRLPLVFFWTIPGTVLVGPALSHATFAEVVGAFHATALLLLALGASGWISRIMKMVPMPIVMGMVAGVFMQFALDWLSALQTDWLLAGCMTLVFFGLTALPALGRLVPPLIGALLCGILLTLVLGRMEALQVMETGPISLPVLVVPAWSWRVIFELTVPLAVTVLVVQNGQGVAVLHQAGHGAPTNFITVACGIFSSLAALAGTVSTCLTGPTNALISSSGPRESHYVAGVLVGVMALAFGLFAPLFTRWMLAMPAEFVATLAGLALLRVLQTAFNTAFGSRFQLGALLSFVITISGVTVANIGAPFWGLVVGLAMSRWIEADQYRVDAD